MTTTGGGDVQELTNTIVNVQISLARIEESLKPLAALAATVNEVKDVSREALSAAQQANTRLAELEMALSAAREVADDARRKADNALVQLAAQQEWQKWLKRTFYGAIITAAGGGVVAAVWAAINIIGG